MEFVRGRLRSARKQIWKLCLIHMYSCYQIKVWNDRIKSAPIQWKLLPANNEISIPRKQSKNTGKFNFTFCMRFLMRIRCSLLRAINYAVSRGCSYFLKGGVREKRILLQRIVGKIRIVPRTTRSALQQNASGGWRGQRSLGE